ncbi:YeeE/YedE family protein [Guyparkeria halophila]|uniref:YeeE/YedE family protein n=2 Tax=Guyparkeria halophila TaxID=47960 RepID=A0A6I6D7G4_9GAMM|nr:YeeE/YedE family protein [Guyparkeria halophila]
MAGRHGADRRINKDEGSGMDPAISQYLLYVLVLSVVFGGAAQFTRFCLLGGMSAYMGERDGGRMAVYLGAIGVAIVVTTLVQWFAAIDLDQTRPPYRTADFAWGRYLIGGLLFGAGMVLARGCPVRSLVRTSQGSLQALVAIVVMAVAAYAMTRTSLFQTAFLPWVGALSVDLTAIGIPHQDLAALVGGGPLVYGLIAAALAALLLAVSWRWLPLGGNGLAWFGVLLLGTAVGLGFWVTGGAPGQAADMASMMQTMPQEGLGTQSFTFSAPLGDVVYFLQNVDNTSTITFGVVAVVGVFLGSLVSALVRRDVQFAAPRAIGEWLRTVIGAAMVGVGAVLAMGCTVGHGLTGLSTLALGSMLSIASIMLGAWITLRIQRRRADAGCAG